MEALHGIERECQSRPNSPVPLVMVEQPVIFRRIETKTGETVLVKSHHKGTKHTKLALW
ncbi:MAG: hypothetical protein AB1846_02695 [Chloroflexota bacterium]